MLNCPQLFLVSEVSCVRVCRKQRRWVLVARLGSPAKVHPTPTHTLGVCNLPSSASSSLESVGAFLVPFM